ncbi:MAG: hypothetical protein OWQ59_11140 [Alicyclobacillaceae bacterium]|uniref:hypothetical protein n=1 Tax=Alicyclobacillus sp. SP_1 TaxID=2942475 RepID=UPI002157A5B4|nr:hypothetical protein [Alicyclobacillus sp. SP_1]MCY0888995.1 hypothetical protein [Alicyclobacillaceae bacterium]MCY0896706.1 hypothetical protein [Alicyclobacillaceae bacterium]
MRPHSFFREFLDMILFFSFLTVLILLIVHLSRVFQKLPLLPRNRLPSPPYIAVFASHAAHGYSVDWTAIGENILNTIRFGLFIH